MSINATATVSLPWTPSNGVDLALNGTLRSSGYESWTVPCVLAGAGGVTAANNSVFECDATLLQKVVHNACRAAFPNHIHTHFLHRTPLCRTKPL